MARFMAALMVCGAILASPLPATAQTYPARPVHFVVGFAAGGFADTVARLLGLKVSERLGQPVVVENRGGAGGNVAARFVAAASPDGYTILVNTAAMAVNTTLYKAPGFNALADFVPIMITASAPEAFVVEAGSPAATLRDLVAEHKGKRLTYATAGIGSSSHVAGDYLFRRLAELDAVHVPFKGGAPAITATLSGQVNALALTLTPMLPHIRQGKLKALAVASRARVPALPDVPTVREAGLGDLEAGSWVGFFAPAKTSPEVVATLNKALNEALGMADVRERFAALSVEPLVGTPAEVGAMFRFQVENWARMVKTTGIVAE